MLWANWQILEKIDNIMIFAIIYLLTWPIALAFH
jgi:hypothetical protein